MKIDIALSFDHELSLGSARDYARNLFVPTERVLETAAGLAVPVTLFTDVLCAMRFKDWDEAFFHPYAQQIGAALKGGHDVQLHLHPHWLTTTFSGGTFHPSQDFALSSFQSLPWPDNIPGIVQRSVEFLSGLCRAVDPSYRCIAFRAGGYNLAPDTAAILEALYANGIRIDSSIGKGFRFRSGLSVIDFRQMPQAANWFIPPQGPLNAEASSGIFEVPIATRPRHPVNNIPFLVKRIMYRKRAYRSGGTGIHENNTSMSEKLGRLWPRSAWMLGFDHHTDSGRDVLKTLEYHVRKHRQSERIVCAAISHPKSMGEDSLNLMREFTLRARETFGSSVNFHTFRQIADAQGLASE